MKHLEASSNIMNAHLQAYHTSSASAPDPASLPGSARVPRPLQPDPAGVVLQLQHKMDVRKATERHVFLLQLCIYIHRERIQTIYIDIFMST